MTGREADDRSQEWKPEDYGEPDEGYGELLKYTLAGFAGGLVLGAILDWLGFQRAGWGQWLVRTLSGEGESVFEGIYALKQRMAGAASSMAEAYGWGKAIGLIFPWFVDGLSRLAGVDVYAIESFYVPWFYAMSDQMGANVAGLVYLRRREGSWRPAIVRYVRHPVMLTSLAVVFAAPLLIIALRMGGLVPATQTLTAVETIAANLCWLPPVVGWWMGRRERL